MSNPNDNQRLGANQIRNNAITVDKLVDGAVSTDKLQNLVVTTPKLGELSVTTSKLQDTSVDSTKLHWDTKLLYDTNPDHTSEPVIKFFPTKLSILDNSTSLTEKIVFQGDGNVGIGTTSTSKKLEVVGETLFKYQAGSGEGGTWFTFQNTDDTPSQYNRTSLKLITQDYAGTATTSAWIQAENGNLSLRSDGWIGLVPENSANVGIRKGYPGFPLDIEGMTKIKDDGEVLRLAGDTISYISFYRDNVSRTGYFGFSNDNNVMYLSADKADGVIRGYVNGNSVFYHNDGSSGFYNQSIYIDSYLRHNEDSDTYLYYRDDRISLYAGGVSFLDLIENDTQDSFSINTYSADIDTYIKSATGNGIFVRGSDGNVGIGTDSPQAKLDVESDTDSLVLLGKAYVGQVLSGPAGRMFIGHINHRNVTSYALEQDENGATLLNSADGQNLYFRINNSDVMRINSSGNVGIGTDAPTYQLDVDGQASITGEVVIGGTTTSTDSYLDLSLPNGGLGIYDDVTNATDVKRGFRFTQDSGNLYLDTKTYTGGYVYFRTGEGAESGASHYWMAVTSSNQSVTLYGNLDIPEYIYHSGDTDTWLRFQTNAFALQAGGHKTIEAVSTNLNLTPAGDLIVNPGGNDLYPLEQDINLGTTTNKWLTLHARELWVSTLVAQDVMATIGGRVVVAPTTYLTAAFTAIAGADVIHTKHNNYQIGDVLFLESDGKFEAVKITSAPIFNTDEYTANCIRNFDGDTATFSVEATGGKPLSYQWKVDGEDIPNANEPEYKFIVTSADDGKAYSCVISDSNGTVESDAAILTVL